MTLHFLHVGKTGGTAIKGVLRHQLGVPNTPFGRLNMPTADTLPLRRVPRSDYVMFCVRDPIARFASAFYSRLHQGQPRYWFPWSEYERETFTRWPTPQGLVESLRSDDVEERAAAEFAMGHIRHVHRMSDKLGNRELLEERRDSIVYIGRQETLAADWQHLREILDLPRDSQLPNDPVRAHRGDPKADRSFTAEQRAVLEEWYAEDFGIVEFAEQIRQKNGWGVPIPDAVPGLAAPGTRKALLPPGPLTKEKLTPFRGHNLPMGAAFSELLNDARAERVAEIGVYRGNFAQQVLNNVPSIETYYLLGPGDEGFGQFEMEERLRGWREAIDRTEFQGARRVVLEGPADKMLEGIPEESLDYFHLGQNSDLSLRGVTLNLHRAWPKVRAGGWIGGGQFHTVLHHRGGLDTEPNLIYPYAVYFAELMGCRVFALPNRQFIIEKDPARGFEFVRVSSGYRFLDLRTQLKQYAENVIREYEWEKAKAEREAAEARAQRNPLRRSARMARRNARRVKRRVRRLRGAGS